MAICVLVLACQIDSVRAAEVDFKAARTLLQSGKYEQAEEMYRPAAEKSAEAALGMARALDSQGKWTEAVKTLRPLSEKSADLQAELARLAFEHGDVATAQACVDRSLKLSPGQVEARWFRAELARTAGRLDDAEKDYHRLVVYYNDHDNLSAEQLHWIGLGAAQYARWKRLSDQFDFLVNQLYPDALKADPSFWQAHFEAGQLFAEKYNYADATKEFQVALLLNPRAAEVHAAMAALPLEHHDLDTAERSFRRALEINPTLIDAWLLTADVACARNQTAEALKILQEKTLPLNPLYEQTLARVAVCYHLLDSAAVGNAPSRFTKLVDEVMARNAHAGEFFTTMAELFEALNRLPEAETHFRQAMRVMPRHVGPQAGLGMLLMRTGRESDARRLLKAAFEADPFHVRVKNTLEVLDLLDGMKTVGTPHFTLRATPEDTLLAARAAEVLEAIHADLKQQFGYEPPSPTLVEIFHETQGQDGHAWFATRMVGVPDLGTVAASSGHVVALVSPDDPAGMTFNWIQVLRHEMVHVFNLQQTQFNVPRWLTEGLAVRNEHGVRPYRWMRSLRRRHSEGKLFTLDTIDAGFTRPKSSDDSLMAYCQAELYVDFMVTRGGTTSLNGMLAAYARPCSAAAAVKKVFDIKLDEFERGYATHVKKLLDATPALPEPDEDDFARLEKSHRTRPKDADVAARLAYLYLIRGAEKEARELAAAALAQQAHHPLAGYVQARQRLKAGGKEDEVIELLTPCLDRRKPDPLLLGLLANLKLKQKKYDEAAELFALGERLDPTNPRWTQSLARVDLAAGRPRSLATALARLAARELDDLPSRKKLAELAMERHEPAEAVRWARQALEIKLRDAEVHRLLASALVSRRELPEAIREFETAIELKPDNPQARFALADAHLQAGETEKARHVLEELLKQSPDYPGAAALLESLKKMP